MKRRKFIIIFALIFICVSRLFYLYHMVPEYIKEMVMSNESSYTYVANIYYDDYQKRNKDIMAYSSGETGKIVFIVELFEADSIILSEDEKLHFQKVYETYQLDNQYWERAYVYDTFVSFSNVNGRESFVYSVDDIKPSYVNAPIDQNERKRISVKKITNHWYYVSDK